MDNSITDILIIGCGDIGVRVARLEQAQGGAVAGLARSEAGAERLRGLGIEPVTGDLDEPESLSGLPTAGKLIFFFAPPPGGGPWDTRMRNFCAAVGSDQAPAKVIYISTSGVYGDCGGAWVTEETPVNAQTSRAKRRLDAESVLQEWGARLGVSVVILRVTGIYGPGRLPLARLQQGHPVLDEAESPPTNRIHADDLAAVCVAAAQRAENGEIFNVSDGQPGTMTQYFSVAADLLGLPRPPQVSMEEARRVMTPMMLSYLTETRRMDNRRMMEKLGVTLLYPNLQSGLKNVISQIDQPNMGYLGSVGHG
ncbi:MAG: SDR family oxidoreductase [Desulfuromonadales bacterium]|nr:SDR family oxidoreductase [Desulfuromonadales bacterium]